jgi:hypothetical protein
MYRLGLSCILDIGTRLDRRTAYTCKRDAEPRFKAAIQLTSPVDFKRTIASPGWKNCIHQRATGLQGFTCASIYPSVAGLE